MTLPDLGAQTPPTPACVYHIYMVLNELLGKVISSLHRRDACATE